jgi:LysR family glycine cleavage system transcriptional activator
MARLPPFIALRALEAASRHQSYSRAADELNVTHGAVSHQIRRLEEELGAVLFMRRGNVMEPTPSALKLAARVAEALDVLRSAVEEVSAEAVTDPLVLSTLSSFAGRWLTPRLGRLADDTGETNLEVRAADAMANFVSDGVDAAVRYGAGRWPGVAATPLFTETLFPVCSPAFAKQHGIQRPEDLLSAPLLRQTHRPWSIWFSSIGLEAPETRSGLIFDDSALLLDAAAQGLGAALARSGLVEIDLREGRLIRPFEGSAPAEAGYHFVWRADSRKLKRILRLRDWLLAEASGSEVGS